MAARTVSELANWDGCLDQQRQNSKWRRSSSSLARDPYHTPLDDQTVEIFQPSGKISDQKRAQQLAFRSNLERDSLENSPVHARLPSLVDITSTSSHDKNRYHQASITNTTPDSALQSPPLISSPKLSHLTPNSSVHVSRVHNPQPPSSRGRITLSQPASTFESEVIDLTMEDTEDELSVSEMLVPGSTRFNHQDADPGPRRRPLSSGCSSPIAPEQSLFTPPPPSRKRTRLFIDYLVVPPFPKGLSKADYKPISAHSTLPQPGLASPSMPSDSSPAEPLVTKEHPRPQKLKGKEREHDIVSSHEKCMQHPPADGADVSPKSLDAFYEHTMIPLEDDDAYPPLTTLDLVTNTRFQFAHAWRERASRLREAELDWTFKFRLPGKACIWARSVDVSSPRIPGTAGYISIDQLRSWELVVPGISPQEKSTADVSDEQAGVTESHAIAEAANHLSSPDDVPRALSAALDPTPSSSTPFPQGRVVVEPDMNQYFNGLSDPPIEHVSPCQQLAPTHTFRPRLLQPARNAEANSLGLGPPPLELDLRLADTGNHEWFLGVPPSPTPAGMKSSATPGPILDSSFEPVNYFPASPSNAFEPPPMDPWPFEQGEGLLPVSDSPPSNHLTPTTPGTIDPSLLGPGQSQTSSSAPKDTTLRRRSKLPEPVIYIRRPIDSSRLPMVSGKRPVQIKYRDSGGSPATPSTQTEFNGESSNLVESPAALSTNDTGEFPLAKRRSVPSRKLCEYHDAFGSDSDYVPDTSMPKIKPKLKRLNLRDNESAVEHQGKEIEMSFCHQCRNKSVRPKMLCSNIIQGRVCGKRFCNRCILYRYPDVTFDQHSEGFLCPVCTNTCNCSFCSRNRGEEFISMRLGGLAASLLKTKVTLVRDVGKPLYRANSPPRPATRRSASATTATATPEPGALPIQPRFWAHVYGMEGERVGSAFMTQAQMERLHAHGPSPPPSLSKSQPPKKARKSTKHDKEKTRGPRVFIGRPLASWKVRAVRDLDPSAEVEGKGKGKENARRRRYIGNRAPLYESYGRMPGTASPASPSSRCSTPALDSDGSLTPLHELETGSDYWPQPDVGECCSWAPPPPPGTTIHGLPSDPSVLPGPPAGELPSPVQPIAVGTGLDVDEWQSLASGSGSGVEMEMEMDLGSERRSASTALSGEDLARAISAALAALNVNLP